MNKLTKVDTEGKINTVDSNHSSLDISQKDCSVSSNSFLDYDSLSSEELICRYIMEKKNKGQFLPYEYHAIIHRWVQEAGCVDELLLILDEIFSDSKHTNFGLKTLNKKVMDKIRMNSK